MLNQKRKEEEKSCIAQLFLCAIVLWYQIYMYFCAKFC